MASAYEIEMSEPSVSHCDCCGGLSVRLTRFVHRGDDPFAAYYVAYSNDHPDNEIAMLVSLGEWGEGSTPSERIAFYCRVRPADQSYGVMLDDAAHSPWPDVELMGEKLSREDAQQHPWKATAFEVLDEAFLQDRSLRGFLHRVRCGDASVPLEWNFRAPDDISSLGDEEKHRADLGRSFAALDGERFFVRCLLPVPVEGYGPWCVGLWIEVAKSDYDQAKEVWDDRKQYPNLRFPGVIANDVAASLDLPVAPECKVHLHVWDPEAPPWVEPPVTGELGELLTKPWSRGAFEEYAVARGFL